MDGEEENVGPFRRTSARTRRMASRMASALASSDNRAEAALARLEALESDNAGVEVVDLNDDEYGSTDEEDPVLMQKKAVQDYETQDKAGESFGEEGSKIIHGCLTRSKSGIPASSCPNIFEGYCGSTEYFISTALPLSLW
ncbi:unnamed protein product [Miscanthus lutarioriparius]|uniref:Uncharacterized protein n=1 Tax=Miscanthus lutarioriparius TaxID=422564 RepID=A0A811RFP8_9POAL|nr:unnamed protein product [Miscanthus lutarioriparius]